MKHVEYIAQNYFTDPDEAKAFVDGVRGFAEKDIQREKGYVVFDNDLMEPSWSYGTVNGEKTIPVDEFAKKYGATVEELSETPEKWDAFMDSLSKNRKKWTAEIVTAFESNEKRVADIISQAIGRLSETDVNNGLQRILKAFGAPVH